MRSWSGNVEITDYDPRWPELFDQESRSILHALRHQSVKIEHIGSTAVPGLAAKPTIDLMIGLRRLAEAVDCIPRLAALGYVYVPRFELGAPFRRFFYRARGARHSHHLHMVELDHPFWERHLLFRDFLRHNPAVGREYARLKRQLAHRYRQDIASYSNAKGPFVRWVEERARRSLLPPRAPGVASSPKVTGRDAGRLGSQVQG